MESGETRMAAEAARSRRFKVTVLVVAAVLAGFVGRSVVSGDAADNPLLNWLPWLNRTEITLYFGDASGDHLVPVSRTLSRNAEPAALVAALLDGPAEGTGLINLIPPGTMARSAALVGSVLEVDLAGDFERLAAPLATDALAHSLASWPGAEAAQITVDGVALADSGGGGQLLYFYDESLDMLVAEPTPGDGPRDVLAAYLAGPGDAHLAGLPPDVDLLSFDYTRSSGLLAIDFTFRPSVRDFAVDHPEAVRRVLEGLIATMTAGFPDIDAVWLDFEGHEALGLGQCADLLRTAQTTPDVLNDERLLKRYAGE
jgi:hypothetical protein